MTAYYNEIDPYCAEWLKHLMLEGLIAPGEVDTRSIEDILPSDLRGFTQCHFFAGIGGWSYALRLAGWPDDRAVWTGSCPCQPFSAAGKGRGFADERHLWPSWFHLIRARRPQLVFGEQVASAMQWIDLVQGDLEAEGYASGYAVLGAHSVGAPHIRQRLYWVADSNNNGREVLGRSGLLDGERPAQRDDADRRSADGREFGLGDSRSSRGGWNAGTVSGTEGSLERSPRRESDEPVTAAGMGDADDAGLEGQSVPAGGRAGERTAWSPSDFVWCRDGKWRPVEPGSFPLAHGVPERVGLLRGYGNCIVPQVATAFIGAYLDAAQI